LEQLSRDSIRRIEIHTGDGGAPIARQLSVRNQSHFCREIENYFEPQLAY
jgi:hypothetical protein